MKKKEPFIGKTGKPGEENRLLSGQPNVYAKGITHGEEAFNYRKLSELPTHLLCSKNIDDLKEQVLYNYDFLLRKLTRLDINMFTKILFKHSS